MMKAKTNRSPTECETVIIIDLSLDHKYIRWWCRIVVELPLKILRKSLQKSCLVNCRGTEFYLTVVRFTGDVTISKTLMTLLRSSSTLPNASVGMPGPSLRKRPKSDAGFKST